MRVTGVAAGAIRLTANSVGLRHMPHRCGATALALLFSCATLATCVYPTEHEASVHVSLPPVRILFRGNDTVVAARAWEIRGPGDSQPIPNVAFVWSSSDSAVATVAAGRGGGVKAGPGVGPAAARATPNGPPWGRGTPPGSPPPRRDNGGAQ